jgi:hypothetical protein
MPAPLTRSLGEFVSAPGFESLPQAALRPQELWEKFRDCAH